MASAIICSSSSGTAQKKPSLTYGDAPMAGQRIKLSCKSKEGVGPNF